MKFAHCRLWDALVNTHKYSIYCAYWGYVLYIVSSADVHLWIFVNASQSSQKTKFYTKWSRMKFAPCRLWVALVKTHKYSLYCEGNGQHVQILMGLYERIPRPTVGELHTICI
jgi:hypothetical protein